VRDPFDEQREEALELVRLARMGLNPKVYSGWFARASRLLKWVDTGNRPETDTRSETPNGES